LTRADDGGPPLDAHNFVLQTLRATWDNLPQLLVGMVWLNLSVAPALALALLGLDGLAVVMGVLLAAPGWVALQHVQSRLVQDKTVPALAFLGSLRRFWRRAMNLGALALALPVVTFLAAAGLGELASGLVAPVLVAGSAASLLVVSVLVLYAAPLLVLYDQELAGVLRNSLILPARHINNTLGMVALAVLCALAAVYLSSGLIFVLPTLYGMFVINNCRLVIEQEG
jgi:uncharacterized membrane protein YesL